MTKDRRIVLACALQIEQRALRSLGGGGVEIEVSGMGPGRAAELAERLCASRPRAVVAAGFCGALDPSLRRGAVVVAATVRDIQDGTEYPADPALLAAAHGRHGVVVTARQLVRAPERRASLRSSGDCVDMESAAIARVARRTGTPFIAVRAVTDTADDPVPDLANAIDERGRVSGPAIAALVLRRPRAVGDLARLGIGAHLGGWNLRRSVGRLIERIS